MITRRVRCPECCDPLDEVCGALTPTDCSRVTVIDGVPICPHTFDIAACQSAMSEGTVDSRIADARLAADDFTDDSTWRT
jgi:hypothetical protein